MLLQEYSLYPNTRAQNHLKMITKHPGPYQHPEEHPMDEQEKNRKKKSKVRWREGLVSSVELLSLLGL